MELYLIAKKYTYNITNVVTSFEWSGSLDQVSRSLKFSIVNAPLDSNLKLPTFTIGHFVKLVHNSKVYFYGMIYNAEKSSEVGTIDFTAYDLLYHFKKSSWYKKFTNTTAEKITAICAKEVGVKTNSVVKTGAVIPKLIAEDESIYDTMLRAFKKASKKTGKKYHIQMEGSKLCVRETGKLNATPILSDASNITSASIEEDGSKIVNRVKIYDSNNKLLSTVSSSKSVSKYGVFQETYTKEDGVDAKTGAKALLSDVTQKLSIEAIGNITCLSGYSVIVHDSATGLNGKYWITSDSHTFEDGIHTMSLELDYKSMDA